MMGGHGRRCSRRQQRQGSDRGWEASASARFFRRLASFRRLIIRQRGTGLSDPFTGIATLEERSDDARAVMDAVDSSSAFVCGLSDRGPMSVLFSATFPERTRGLILIGSNVRMLQSSDWPYGWTPERYEEFKEGIEQWGQGGLMNLFLPSFVGDERAARNWARYQRMGASPGNARHPSHRRAGRVRGSGPLHGRADPQR
jgi:pimeloyl-ACP methyl ester carboxylesterase